MYPHHTEWPEWAEWIGIDKGDTAGYYFQCKPNKIGNLNYATSGKVEFSGLRLHKVSNKTFLRSKQQQKEIDMKNERKDFDESADFEPTERPASSVNDTLNQREATYGKFPHQAEKAQALKDCMHRCSEWGSLSPSQKEALDMIQHKIARILNGKGNDYSDNWHDIAGYATLVERELTAATVA